MRFTSTFSIFSRVFFEIEAAAVFVVAAILWLFLLWGLPSINDLSSAVVAAATIVISLGSIAMVNVLRQLIRSGNLADVESLKRDVTLALVGGIAAVMMTFWSHTGMSPNDRWSDGYDFLEAGCVLWVPIFHVFFLISAKRILTRRSTDRV